MEIDRIKTDICFSIYSITETNVKVFLGRQQQSGSDPNEISRSVDRVITHPSYSTSTQNNDIALLQLSSSVTFTDYVRPVCLAAAGSVFGGGTKSWITGWGKLNSAGEFNQTRQRFKTLNNVSQQNDSNMTVSTDLCCRHISSKHTARGADTNCEQQCL